MPPYLIGQLRAMNRLSLSTCQNQIRKSVRESGYILEELFIYVAFRFFCVAETPHVARSPRHMGPLLPLQQCRATPATLYSRTTSHAGIIHI